MELTITIQGDKEAIAGLKKLGKDVENFTVPFKKAGSLMTKFFSTVPFASQGSVYGRRWPALTEDYAKRKATKFPGRPILVGRGDLPRSFKFESSSKRLRIFNDAGDLFRWHQLGEGNNPQRIMMLLDKQRQNIIVSEAEKYIQDKVANAF